MSRHAPSVLITFFRPPWRQPSSRDVVCASTGSSKDSVAGYRAQRRKKAIRVSHRSQETSRSLLDGEVGSFDQSASTVAVQVIEDRAIDLGCPRHERSRMTRAHDHIDDAVCIELPNHRLLELEPALRDQWVQDLPESIGRRIPRRQLNAWENACRIEELFASVCVHNPDSRGLERRPASSFGNIPKQSCDERRLPFAASVIKARRYAHLEVEGHRRNGMAEISRHWPDIDGENRRPAELIHELPGIDASGTEPVSLQVRSGRRKRLGTRLRHREDSGHRTGDAEHHPSRYSSRTMSGRRDGRRRARSRGGERHERRNPGDRKREPHRAGSKQLAAATGTTGTAHEPSSRSRNAIHGKRVTPARGPRGKPGFPREASSRRRRGERLGDRGFEPRTSALSERRSNQLS